MTAQITSFDKNNASTVCQEVITVLNAHFAGRGLTFTRDNGSYNPESVRVKITATVNTNAAGTAALTPQQKDYKRLCILNEDLPELGATFVYNSTKYTIIGASLRSRRYPILCKRDGATLLTKFTVATVRHACSTF